MNRISFDPADIGLINTLLVHIKDQASALPRHDYVVNAIRESILVKAEMIEKIEKKGVIEE